MKTLVALFDDISVARQVLEDLVRADFARDSIHLVTNDAQNQYSRFLDADYKPRKEAVTALEGAGFGAIVGALTGILMGIVALLVPNLGLVILAGPVVGTLTGILAGALMGGLVAALIKIGVPEDETPYYAEAIKRGATLIRIETNRTHHAEQLLHRYGTIDIHERISQWHQAESTNFDAVAETKTETEEPGEIAPVKSKKFSRGRLSPLHPILGKEVKILWVIEPEIDDEDTEKSIVPASPVEAVEAPVGAIRSEPLPLLIEETAEVNTAVDFNENPVKSSGLSSKG